MGYVGDVTECHPRPWRSAVLSDLAHYRRGSFPQPYGLRRWYDDIRGFPFIQVFDVDDNGRLKETTKRRISAEARALSVSVPEGTVILTIQGSIGRVAITQYDACIDRTLLIFERFKVPIDKRYFKYAIFELFEREKKNAPGGIIKTITKEALSKFQLVYPPLPEQQAIATALSDADAYIESLEQLITKKRQIKQGVMQELLTGKRRLPGFEGEWPVVRLEAVLSFQAGYPFSAEFFTQMPGVGIRLVRNRDLKGDAEVLNYLGSYSQDFVIRDGDVLVGMDAEFITCLWDRGAAILNQRVGRLKPKDNKLDARFAFYYLAKPLKVIETKTSSTTVKHLSHREVESIEVPLPPFREQQAIGQVLGDIDEEIRGLDNKLYKVRGLKQAMMQQLLTGKIRLV